MEKQVIKESEYGVLCKARSKQILVSSSHKLIFMKVSFIYLLKDVFNFFGYLRLFPVQVFLPYFCLASL
jgi:hypothetical protein